MLTVLFAGLWSEIWRYGIGGGLIAALLAAAYFSPILKKDFLYAAAVVAAFLSAFAYGVSIGEKRVTAQWNASIEIADKAAKQARSGAVRDVNRPRRVWSSSDRFNRDQHKN